MRHSNGRDGNNWLVVDDNGQRTLFQLVEMGKETDIMRLGGELPAPAIVVDIALPVLPAFNEEPKRRSRSTRSRLILLKVRTATGGDANSVVRLVPQPPGRLRMADVVSQD